MKKRIFFLLFFVIFLFSCGEQRNERKIIEKIEEKEENIQLKSDNEEKLQEILKRSQSFSESYGGNITEIKDISGGELEEIKNIKKENYVNQGDNIENNEIKKENQIEKEEEIFKLKPFKDELFSYHDAIEEKLNGNWRLLEFSMEKDVEDRDEIDVDKVYEKYIDRKTEKYREIKSLYGVKGFDYYEVTDRNQEDSDKKIVTIYFHGKGGNKTWGINDETFGGNFNRIQNLMIENSGVYITTDTILGEKGVNEHTKLLSHLKTKYKNAKIILIGGSNGGLMLWDLVNNKESQYLIDGIILAGTVLDEKNQVESTKFLVKNKIPVYIAHGNKDHIPFEQKETFLKKFLIMGGKGKVVIFNGGVHGTPIRMIDYKEAINWMISIFEKNN